MAMRLPDGEIHVRQADLAVSESELETLLGLLDGGERGRAGRFHREEDRRRFIAAHGLMRTVLGHYLSADPAGLRFVTGRWGKPALAGADATTGIRFSMSHSQELGLFAVASGREVGVDVERVQADFDWAPIARNFFSDAELSALAALPESARRAAFFDLWACKEARVKATGGGLGEAEAQARGIAEDSETPRAWTVRRLDLGPGWAAALAAQGKDWDFKLMRSAPRSVRRRD